MLARFITSTIFLFVTNAIAAFVPVFYNIETAIPLPALCFGQLSLVFLFVLIAFPKAKYSELMNASTQHIGFLVQSYALLTFLPVPFKLFLFNNLEETLEWIPFFAVPAAVDTNITSLVLVNIFAFAFLIVFPHQKAQPAKAPTTSSEPVEIEEDLIIKAPQDIEHVGEIKKDSKQNTVVEEEQDEELKTIEEALGIASDAKSPASPEQEEAEEIGDIFAGIDSSAPPEEQNEEDVQTAMSIAEQVLAERAAERAAVQGLEEKANAAAEETLSEEQIQQLAAMASEDEPFKDLEAADEDVSHEIEKTETSAEESSNAEPELEEQAPELNLESQEKDSTANSQEQMPEGLGDDGLFNVYLKDEKIETTNGQEMLKKMENTLLDNIDFRIEEALCISENKETVDDSLFHWRDPSEEKLFEIFERYRNFSQKQNTEDLCQIAFKEGKYWYMMSHYNGFYLILKTSHEEASPLLETTYKVFSAL